MKSSFLDGQKLQVADVILASEGFLDIIDSRILKFPSMNCAKVNWRGLDASHQGQKYDRKVTVAYLTLPDALEPFEERQAIVVVACSVDWSNCLFEGAAAFGSQNSASILASSSSSLKGASD